VEPDRVTQLLNHWQSGQPEALDELLPLVYNQLHHLASSCSRREKRGHTLRTTELVHEAALAARVIRHILTNHGKAKHRDKRGGGALKLSLDPREARVVELVYFAGLEQDLAAEAIGISPATLRRELRMAKSWLYNELSRGPEAQA
jgi:DNA-directed RNA polymerase specialized sigma24 family protein